MLGHCPQSMHHRSCTIDRLRAQSCAYGHANGSCLLGQRTADRSFFRNLYYSWRIFVYVYRTQAPTSYNKKVFFFFLEKRQLWVKLGFYFCQNVYIPGTRYGVRCCCWTAAVNVLLVVCRLLCIGRISILVILLLIYICYILICRKGLVLLLTYIL